MNTTRSDDGGHAIRAIQTYYAGCHFRSRLEARWAVFFNALGIPWQYEPEGFDLPTRRYLPDFFLPSVCKAGAWYEVKGGDPTAEESMLMYELAEATGKDAFIAWGDIPDGPDSYGYDRHTKAGNAGHRGMLANGDMDYSWCLCCECGEPGIEYEGRGARVHSYNRKCKATRSEHSTDKCCNADDPKLLAAYSAARSARFEYGETPR